MRRGAAPSPLKRTIQIALVAIAALLSLTPAQAEAPQHIVAVGDLHGDYDAWQDIARAAGLVDPRGHWAAGRTTFVQLGDIVDREPNSLQIIRSLQQLQKEAPRSGGKVIVVLGNHEAMNLLGDYRYTTPGEFAAFVGPNSAAVRERVFDQDRPAIEKAAPQLSPAQVRDAWMAQHPLGWVEHRLAWSPSGELGQWAARNPAVLLIGGTLFVHGGLSAEYARLPIEDINASVRSAMHAADDRPNSVLNDPLGPLWYRGLVGLDAEAEAARVAVQPATGRLTRDQEVDAVLRAYGAQRLVIGHTPDLNGIEFLSRGRLARIDTGISRFYGGPLTWLEIIGGRMVPHSVRRSTP